MTMLPVSKDQRMWAWAYQAYKIIPGGVSTTIGSRIILALNLDEAKKIARESIEPTFPQEEGWILTHSWTEVPSEWINFAS